jgi:hypothetical protein
MYQVMAGFGVPAKLMRAEAAAERWPGLSFGRDPVLYHPGIDKAEPVEEAAGGYRA